MIKKIFKNSLPQNFKIRKFYKQIFKKIETESNFFSRPDERYKHLLKKLDITQIKALTYATKSIPEFINIRADKSFMTNSIEIRQPYLSKRIVGFLCSLPLKFRVARKTKLGKIYFRQLIQKNAVKSSLYPKVGFWKKFDFRREGI